MLAESIQIFTIKILFIICQKPNKDNDAAQAISVDV